MSPEVQHRPWCPGDHISDLCVTNVYEVQVEPESIALWLGQEPEDTGPKVYLELIISGGAVHISLGMTLEEARLMRAHLDEVIALGGAS
jgi:hypothetical protein